MEPKAAKNLLVSFSKRRTAVIRKASELCTKCDAEVAVVVVSQSGNTFSFGHSSVDDLLRRYANPSIPTPEANKNHSAAAGWKRKASELKALRAKVRKLNPSGSDEYQNCHSVAELEETKAKYLNLLQKVHRKLANHASSSSASSSSSGGSGGKENDIVSFVASSASAPCSGSIEHRNAGSSGSGGQENDVPFSAVNNVDSLAPVTTGSEKENDIWEGISFDFLNDEAGLDFSSCNDANFLLHDHQTYMSF